MNFTCGSPKREHSPKQYLRKNKYKITIDQGWCRSLASMLSYAILLPCRAGNSSHLEGGGTFGRPARRAHTYAETTPASNFPVSASSRAKLAIMLHPNPDPSTSVPPKGSPRPRICNLCSARSLTWLPHRFFMHINQAPLGCEKSPLGHDQPPGHR